MSRIPRSQPRSNTKTPTAAPASPTKTALASGSRSAVGLSPGPGTRTRTISSRSNTAATPKRSTTPNPKAVGVAVSSGEDVEAKPALSIKEAIALKRAEAKKAAQQTGKSTSAGSSGSSGYGAAAPVRQRIRDNPFVNEVEEEQGVDALGRSSVAEVIERGRSSGAVNLSARSLSCLPPSLFEVHLGITPDPLKSTTTTSVDNETLPARNTGTKASNATPWFAAQDLTTLKAFTNEIVEIQHEISLFGSLKVVDLHANAITALPSSFGDLTQLTVLDLSQNRLTALPDNIWTFPELTSLNISNNQLQELSFGKPFSSSSTRKGGGGGGGFFGPVQTRSSVPLPKLVTLNAAHNNITAEGIDVLHFPALLVKLDLAFNPLARAGDSGSVIHNLTRMVKLRELRMEGADIGDEAFEELNGKPVTKEGVVRSIQGRELHFDGTPTTATGGDDQYAEGVLRVVWEIEAERRARERGTRGRGAAAKAKVPEPKRAAETATATTKEAWELDAEAGLLTEGGRRRARAKAMEEAAQVSAASNAASTSSSSSTSSIYAQYFTRSTQTLTLPPSAARPRRNRASDMDVRASASAHELALPIPSVPLYEISLLPFASTLKVLCLKSRRADRSWTVPGDGELDLEGCNFADTVPVSGLSGPTQQTLPLIPLITSLFPHLRTLNLSYNLLTSRALTREALEGVVLLSRDDAKGISGKGLKHLNLRGNKLSSLDGFVGIAEALKSDEDELDLRDNDVDKLPPEMGMFPMEVFLVDGNAFRIPPRRIWEREGTKGLLSWLRGRME
ncbi:hypothetical protein BDP27DRAFT_1391006 [Rhodocollybia butyracea]|uniref:L domain-like protein n=1 Tax=Rhodocollybia butyracea TaxID=206335 RepID=A0A9P5Q208_9AGAR|nr:hypothetical protein BDP27DRAFT_1391006 [Rhodocollybia butyracea]